MRGTCAAVLLAFLLAAGPADAAETPGVYTQRVADALAAVRRAAHASGAARAGDLRSARALLPATVPVRVGALTVRSDLSGVRSLLTTGRLAEAEAALAALRGALAAPSAHAAIADPRRLAALDAILRAPPFTSPPDAASSLERLLRQSPLGALWAALNRLLDGAFGAATTTALVPVAAGVVAAAALLFAASRLFGRIIPAASVDEAPESPLLTRLDAAEAEARAATLAAVERYREAARYTFLATLLTLDSAGLVRIDEATGNRDVLRQARATPRLAEALTPVVRGFDQYWFGHVACTRDDYAAYCRLNERALQVTR